MNKRQCKKLYLKRHYTVGDGFDWPWKTRRYHRAKVLAGIKGWIAEFDRLAEKRADRRIERQQRQALRGC